MKLDIIIAASIILTLTGVTWKILTTIMQPEQPICEKEGYPIPQEYCRNEHK